MMHRMIRIFLSSTFTNFKSERDSLAEEVFPYLERICDERGFSFQVIDLRWGVSKENAAENRNAQICFDEIRRCQEWSPQLNFLIMAGERYGWNPLPTTIERRYWELLTEDIRQDDPLCDLLHAYYQKDDNDLRDVYILKARDADTNRGDNDESLRQRLYELAKQKGLPCAERFSTSATELEIAMGYRKQLPARENTFLLFKRGHQLLPEEKIESEEALSKAEELFQSLKKSASSAQYIEYNEQVTDPKRADYRQAYLPAVKRFLEDAIQKQMNQAPPLDGREMERDILRTAYARIPAQYIPLPDHEALEKRLAGGGRVFLLTGPSGSGKSTFLRWLASRHTGLSEVTAAVFTDIMPRLRELDPMLSFLTEELRRQGALETPHGSEADEYAVLRRRHPILWWEKQLSGVKKDKTVFILVDTLEEAFLQEPESLLQIAIPSNVTLIATVSNRTMLRKTVDLMPCVPEELSFPGLNEQTAIDLLCKLLKRQGRCLQMTQWKAVRFVLPYDAGELTPLYLELLAQKLAYLPSWENLSTQKVLSFSALVQEVLLLEGRKDYCVFRKHALGFLAIAQGGLSEQELLCLLSQDYDVIKEISEQSEWDFPALHQLDEKGRPRTDAQGAAAVDAADAPGRYKGKIPVVLWSMFYAQIHSLLMEWEVNGIVLLQLRHQLLRQELLHLLDSRVRGILLNIMRGYFERKSWYLKSESKVMEGNWRKAMELLPLYEALGQMEPIHRCLEDVHCADTFVRCAMSRTLLEYYLRYATSEREILLLSQLQRKDLLYQLWPDSFLPSVLSELKALSQVQDVNRILALTGLPGFLERDSAGFSGEGIFFPQLSHRCMFALSDTGLVAAYDYGIVRIFDLNRGIATPCLCRAEDAPCFLYWKERLNHLVIRYARSRCHLVLEDNQLRIERKENCPNWEKLYSDDRSKIKAAGGMREREVGLHSPRPGGWIQYYDDGEFHRELLFPEGGASHPEDLQWQICLHGNLCAILTNSSKLEIVNLSRRLVLERRTFSLITDVAWAPSGKQILIVLRGNTLLRLAVNENQAIEPMRNPTATYLGDRIGRIREGIRSIGHDMLVSDLRVDAAEWQGKGAGVVPVFCALSLRDAYIACYYRFRSVSILRLYELETLRPLNKPMRTDTILNADRKGQPLYPASDRRGVIYVAGGKPTLLDLDHKTCVTPAPKSACWRTYLGVNREMEEAIKMAYEVRLREKMLLEPEQKREERRSSGLLHWFFRTKKCSPEDRSYYGDKRVLLYSTGADSSDIVYWIADQENGIVSAFDQNGNCLGRDMPGRFYCADTQDGRLYVLMEATLQIVSYHFHLNESV